MKKYVTLLVSALLCSSVLIGCNNPKEPPINSTIESHTGNMTETLQANPKSDFEYQIREDGEFEITKYVGTDEHVIIPQSIDGKNVTVIGERSFAGANILSLVMPDTVIYVFSHAFSGCENLTDIKMSASLITVSWGAFINCNSLTCIDLSMESMKYIDEDAFKNCQNLKTVKFGNNIQSIRKNAFYGCASLEEVILPKNLQEIGEYAFGECFGVKKVWIPKTLDKWGWYPFFKTTLVTEIVFEEGLKTIGSYGVFRGCQVEVLRIPASVESIAMISFTAFPNLKEVYFEGAAPKVDEQSGIFDEAGQNVTVYYNPSMSGWDTTPLRDEYTLTPYEP